MAPDCQRAQRLRRAAIVAACALVACASRGHAVLAHESAVVPGPASAARQDLPPVFTGGVELVQLTVSVLDGRRQPVRGLSVADFTVFDEGVPRPIRAFSSVDLASDGPEPPGSAPWLREVPSDVASNQVGEQSGRLVTILMDRSIPHEAPVVAARAIATAIVDGLGPNDLAALISTSGGSPQNFTADRARLIRAINQRDWATDSDQYPWGLEASLEDGRCLCGVCVLDTVTRVAEAVRDVSSRSPVLFFIGKGLILQAPPRAPTADPGCDRLTRDARLKMLEAIARSNLTVHAVDPSGLNSIGPQTRASSRGGGPLPEGVAARQRREAQLRETTDTLETQNSLRVLPDLTGGRTVVNRNRPEEAVPEIFRESESYYLLAFEPATDGRPDRPRSIEVKVRRNGVRVSTRRRYLPQPARAASQAQTDSAPTSPAVGGALGGLLPDAVPPLTMALSAFANPAGSDAFVHVQLDARAFVPDALSSIPLQVAVAVVDQSGQVVASAREAVTIVGPRPTLGRETPVEVQTHVAVPRGDYEVRVSVTDPTRGVTASVFAPLVVPDFDREPLSLSHLAVERLDAPEGLIAPFVPIASTIVRAFPRSARVGAFLQVYQGRLHPDAVQPISLRVTVRDSLDRVVSETTNRLNEAGFANRRADVRTALVTDALAPGDYLLSVVGEAGRQSVRRTLRFRVTGD